MSGARFDPHAGDRMTSEADLRAHPVYGDLLFPGGGPIDADQAAKEMSDLLRIWKNADAVIAALGVDSKISSFVRGGGGIYTRDSMIEAFTEWLQDEIDTAIADDREDREGGDAGVVLRIEVDEDRRSGLEFIGKPDPDAKYKALARAIGTVFAMLTGGDDAIDALVATARAQIAAARIEEGGGGS